MPGRSMTGGSNGSSRPRRRARPRGACSSSTRRVRHEDRACGAPGPHYLGAGGKIAHGIVSVTSLWVDEAVYSPLHVAPYTTAKQLPKGKAEPAFRPTPPLAVERIDATIEAGCAFRAVVADCLYGEHPAVQTARWAGALPSVLGRRAHRGRRPAPPQDAAQAVP